MENDPHNYISLDKYLSICEENGIVRKDDKLQLSGYLHDLGVCLHFQDDPVLSKTVILKPEWATEAVYKILDDENVNRNFGRFSKPDIEVICNESIYDDMHSHILQLMLNFKLCYEIPNRKGYYIAPQLLSVNKPKYEWDENENVIIRYTYKFMPKGIISRFIVAMHEDIYKENQKDCVWKRGVVLEKYETKAEVIENYEEREIKIRVVGKHKKELITIVTYELDNIHNSFSHLKCEKQVPCNCSKCKNSQNPFFYSFDTLMKFVGDRKYEIQCQNSYEMVNVLGLIDDVVNRKESYEPDSYGGDEKAVFISYLHENTDDVKKLCDNLTKNGVKVWLDNNDIEPGYWWQDDIAEAIQKVSFFIACFSKEYNQRDETYMNEELILAIERLRKFSINRVWFIPVLLSKCEVPNMSIGAGKTLRSLQRVALYENWDANIQKILNMIQ
jgi:hypothetical protein